MTEEQKQRARENLAKAREAKKAMGSTAVAEKPAEKQCVVCGIRFEDIERHMLVAHPNVDFSLSEPKVPEGARPGTIIKPAKGPSYKVPYSKEWAKEHLEWVDFVPPVTQWVTWNRLNMKFEAGVPTSAPKELVAIYNEFLMNQNRPTIPVEAQARGVYRGGVGQLPEV